MKARLTFAVVNTLLEEAALAIIVLWVLPKVGVQIPLWGLIVLMVVWGAYSVITYRIGSRALNKKLLVGLPDMVGSKGKVVSRLAPEGMVRIRGELWVAKSVSGEMKPGEEVIVVKQDKLKLIVSKSSNTNDLR